MRSIGTRRVELVARNGLRVPTGVTVSRSPCRERGDYWNRVPWAPRSPPRPALGAMPGRNRATAAPVARLPLPIELIGDGGDGVAVRSVLRGVRGRCGLQALAGQNGHRVRRPPLLPAHDEPPSTAPGRELRRGDHRVRAERGGGQLRLLAAAGDVGARRLGQGDRQPRGGVAQAHEADVPRRHDLRRDRGAGQDRVEDARTTAASCTSRRAATSRTARSSARSGARSWCPSGPTASRAAASSQGARYRRAETRSRPDHPPVTECQWGRASQSASVSTSRSTSGSSASEAASHQRASSASSPARRLPPTTVHR